MLPPDAQQLKKVNPGLRQNQLGPGKPERFASSLPDFLDTSKIHFDRKATRTGRECRDCCWVS